uniref:Phosphoserine phosphatase n=1 Tax=Capra hircus TaxID=9925 RepID=A0A8C2RG93_CAPHI
MIAASELLQNVYKSSLVICRFIYIYAKIYAHYSYIIYDIFLSVYFKNYRWTRQAMGGAVPFKAALTQRLALIQPSREQVQRLLAEHPPHLTPGIRELVSRLQERNVQVFLISGGFRSIVEHVASKVNIPSTNVFANRLKFYFNGEYAGFDETQPTAESGGKGKVIKFLKEKFHFKKIIMVGDGATDMEACPPADAFIGFGGNVIRQQVKDNAEWYITDFVELLGALEE